MRARVAAGLVFALGLGGCGEGPRSAGPTPVLARYAGALTRGDAQAAWALLDEEARLGRTEAAHTRLMDTNGTELRAEGQALRRAAAEGIGARARVRLASGETVVLVLEEDGWRIDGGVLDAVGLGSPREAVAAFRRALMRRDLRGIERTLSRQTRAEWEDEVRRLVESTEDEADLEVELQGDQARVHTTGGGVVELVRESGQWRIVDIESP